MSAALFSFHLLLLRYADPRISNRNPVYFRNPHNADTNNNWVLKIGTLKRLYKLVLQ